MKKNIEDYLITFPNFLDKEFCEKTILDLENNSDLWEKHTFYRHSNDEHYSPSGENEPDILFSVKHPNPINDIIIEKLHPTIRAYYNILDLSWFTGWEGYSPIRFTRYSLGTRMHPHCDHIKDIFDGRKTGIPILSILGFLNDDFEGGEIIFFEDKKINIKQGDLLIFPSNFLFPHEVEPVTKGVRYSYVSWIW